MRTKTWPVVRKVKHNNGTMAWLVDCRINGKGERLFYPTRIEAETRAELKKNERRNNGHAGVTMPEKLRIEAMECNAVLKTAGVSLREAVDYYMKHARPSGGLKVLNDVRDEFLRLKAEANRRPEYLRVQKHILGKFCETFGERNANEVHADEISAWFQSQEWSLRTRLNYYNDLSNFFGFGMRKNYSAHNPMKQLDKPSVDETSPPEIFAVPEASELLNASERLGGKMTAFFAIGLFAGLRTAELLKLDWRNVDLEAKTIEVTSNISKTRDHRYVTISGNLAAWLTLHRRDNGPVTPAAWRWHRDQARKEAKLEKWPDNGMRHSFGSYHFAQHQNAALTASEMGHRGNTQTLFAHYRALVRPKDAARYWEIKPEAKGRKVVAFKQAVA
jgi:integrase